MKIKRYTQVTVGLLIVFGLVIAPTGEIVSAQAAADQPATPPTTTPSTKITSGSTKENCIAGQVAVNDITKLKEYGKKRVESRNKYFDGRYSDEKIDAKYTRLELSHKNAADQVRTKLKKNIAVKEPKNHAADLKKERGIIKQGLDEKAKVINDSQDISAVATANCEIIWDLRVWSYLFPKLSNQYALDSLASKNAINKAYYEYAKANNKTAGLTDPSDYDKRIDDLQASLDKIVISKTSPTDTKGFNPENTKSADAFKTQLADLPKLKKDITSQSSKVKSAARSVAQAKKAKTSKKKPSGTTASSSSSGDSSGSSGSSSSGSSSSSGGSSSSSGGSSSGSSSSNSSSSSKSKEKEKTKTKKPAAKKATLSKAEISSICTATLREHVAKDQSKLNGQTLLDISLISNPVTGVLGFANKRGKVKKQLKEDAAWVARSCSDGVKYGIKDFNSGKKTPGACYKPGRKKEVQDVCDSGRTKAIQKLTDKVRG